MERLNFTKQDILNKIKNSLENVTDNRNRMGCSENWYDPFYAIGKTFTSEEIEAMSESELNNMVNLANSIQEALY